MSDQNNSIFVDLNFRTALLESVGWDETQSDSLLLFLKKKLLENSQLPNELLENIRQEYGQSAYTFVKNMFVDVYIEHGLYNKREDDYEH